MQKITESPLLSQVEYRLRFCGFKKADNHIGGFCLEVNSHINEYWNEIHATRSWLPPNAVIVRQIGDVAKFYDALSSEFHCDVINGDTKYPEIVVFEIDR